MSNVSEYASYKFPDVQEPESNTQNVEENNYNLDKEYYEYSRAFYKQKEINRLNENYFNRLDENEKLDRARLVKINKVLDIRRR